MMMKPTELAARDKRRAAVHEGAHAVVAASFGRDGSARLVPNPDGGLWEKHWTGRFWWRAGLAGDRERAAVAVAGMVAEYLDDDPHGTPDDIIEAWRDGVIDCSPTDLEAAPRAWKARAAAVRAAARVLSGSGDTLRRVADYLVTHEAFTGGELRDLLRQTPPPAQKKAKKPKGPAGRAGSNSGSG